MIMNPYYSYCCVLLCCFFPKLIFSQTHTFPPSPYPDRIILTWTENPARTQAVTWRTDTSIQKAYAEISLADASPEFQDRVRRLRAQTQKLEMYGDVMYFHSLTFSELQPETKYIYRVGDSTHWSEWFHFQTAAEEAKPYSFIYFGDAQNEVKSLWARVIREAYSLFPQVDFMLHAGDLINRAYKDDEWGEWFYAGGWIYGMLPSLATPGNHEYQPNPEGGSQMLTPYWKKGFAFPENGPEGLEETAYYIDYQGSRIISLNSQAAHVDKHLARRQAEWLETVLQNNPHPWTIVTMHHPIYSTRYGRDNPRLRKLLQPLFETYGVDVVLQGHDHTYGRGRNIPVGKRRKNSQGPIYVVSVSGPKMYDLGLDGWLERAGSNIQLFQWVEVSGDQLRFRAYTAVGELYDGFSLERKKNGNKVFVDEAPESVPEQLGLPKMFRERYSEEQMTDYTERFQRYKKRLEKQGKGVGGEK